MILKCYCILYVKSHDNKLNFRKVVSILLVVADTGILVLLLLQYFEAVD